ncbi:hypothetical protein CYMTET_57068 [Cymbomonas tetramitiformis]|uniref:Uncharacterized protein n=1 Tax=Cymbomonas tetramitiformis TaxID=36881 RepID=A0AAE0BBC6_9CHLO|nr:hypothetical protein CYMTET_57068 [Cymbomonas tetramitiformis]
MERRKPDLLTEFVVSSCSVMPATAVTHPIDVVKVRMQLQNLSPATHCHHPGVLQTARRMVGTEGVASLYKGLNVGLLRAGVYGGLRIGMYAPLKNAIVDPNAQKTTVLQKLLAGGVSGVLAAGITSPLDLIKVRLQAAKDTSKTKLPSGELQSQGRSSWTIVRNIIKHEGLSGFYKGVTPNMARAAVQTAAQLAAYEESKSLVMRVSRSTKENFFVHLAASMITGVVTTTATTPADMVKTRMYVARGNSALHPIWGPLRTAYEVLAEGGLLGLFRGWMANYVRLGPQTAVTFVVLEQLRWVLDLGSV